ncbi:hypothetical protein EV421DRAFT_1838608 [Armillaria borealis]|uniref:Cellobiose dehydrogenase-like cytochrome domain-containing protein n=1 Tax=Armillaria borealis TaxID=47425 RepID=A0AA39MI89_9AGAR|nr:hypothetical protein EV421DRAFT_1838608 [Armillaria borealis]
MLSRRTLANSVAVLLGIRGAAGQSASAYTDPTTGMTFQALQDSSTGFIFGIALPETIGTDFIGQMVFSLTDGAGWGGASFNGAMTESLLLVAWPNGDEVMTSFREATAYSTPPVYNGSDVTLSTIADGTYVNDTHLSMHHWDDLTFSSTDTSAVLGWAYSTSSPSDVTDESTDLVYHSAGYGEFGLEISNAQTSEYESWAALAVGDDSGSSSSAVSTASSSTVRVSSTTAAVTSTAVASSTKSAASTTSAATSSTASAASSSAAAVTTTKAASTTLAVTTTTTTADSSTITDANVCMNNYNSCIAASQPDSDWDGCGATKDSCLANAKYVRTRRSANLGRRL